MASWLTEHPPTSGKLPSTGRWKGKLVQGAGHGYDEYQQHPVLYPGVTNSIGAEWMAKSTEEKFDEQTIATRHLRRKPEQSKGLQYVSLSCNAITILEKVIDTIEPCVIMVQELAAEYDTLEEKRAKLGALGWAMTYEPSLPTDKGGLSAGVAVLWPKWCQAVGDGRTILFGRARAIPIYFAAYGVVHVVSYHGPVSGSAEEHKEYLVESFSYRLGNYFHFVVGGDYNLEAKVLIRFLRELRIDLYLVALGESTCMAGEGSCIDYFVVSKTSGFGYCIWSDGWARASYSPSQASDFFFEYGVTGCASGDHHEATGVVTHSCLWASLVSCKV